MLIDKVISKIKNYQNFLLMIHEDPDGDTLAATLALFLTLKELKKDVRMVCKDPVPKPFAFLPGCDEIKKDILFGDYEVIFIIDCGDLKRTGFPDRLKKFAKISKNLINIDHHPKNDLWKVANINFTAQNVSSASEIVYSLLLELGSPITKDIATCLMTGIYTDTGGFKHPNTSPETLKVCSELLNSGAQLKKITHNIALNKSIASMKLWGVALSRIRKSPDLELVSSVITRKDLEECGAVYADLAGVVNLMDTIPEAKAAILFFETPEGEIRASLRTERNDVDVSRIAKLFGGGGHKRAAGFTVCGKLSLKGGDWEIALE